MSAVSVGSDSPWPVYVSMAVNQTTSGESSDSGTEFTSFGNVGPVDLRAIHNCQTPFRYQSEVADPTLISDSSLQNLAEPEDQHPAL